MKRAGEDRPLGITALSVFFMGGAAMAFTADVSLLVPGGWLEPIWRLNPRARQAFTGMGPWAIALLVTVGVACALSAAGLWLGARWGHRLAMGLLTVNLLGDVTNVIFGIEPRAAIGVPIAGAMLVYLLSRRVRSFFQAADGG